MTIEKFDSRICFYTKHVIISNKRFKITQIVEKFILNEHKS